MTTSWPQPCRGFRIAYMIFKGHLEAEPHAEQLNKHSDEAEPHAEQLNMHSDEAKSGKLDIKRRKSVYPMVLFTLQTGNYDLIMDFLINSTSSMSFKKCNVTLT